MCSTGNFVFLVSDLNEIPSLATFLLVRFCLPVFSDPSNILFPLVCAGAAAENVLGSLLCLPGSGSVLLDPCTGSTISETTSEAWSVEVLPSDSG